MVVGAPSAAARGAVARRRASAERQAIGSLLALGAGGTGVAFVMYYTLHRRGRARARSLVAYIAPAFAVVYGVGLLSEALTRASAGWS